MRQHAAARACRLARRQAPSRIARSLADFRDRAAGLLAARGRRITVATVASNLILWLVLLACLRGTGLSQAQVPWQTSLAAFAFVRLLTVLPITPGGLGITELGLVGILAASAGPWASAQVTAAVLLYRALTYLPPIPLGAATWLVWRHAPALIHPTPATTAPASLRRRAHNGRQPHRAPAAMTTFRQPPPLTLPANGSGTARPGGLTIEYQRAGNSQVQYCDGILAPPEDCSSLPQPVRTGAWRGPADPAWHDLSTRPHRGRRTADGGQQGPGQTGELRQPAGPIGSSQLATCSTRIQPRGLPIQGCEPERGVPMTDMPVYRYVPHHLTEAKLAGRVPGPVKGHRSAPARQPRRPLQRVVRRQDH
jgi:hypothetical protein